MDRPGTCIILDKKYNIANSSCHFGSYGSIWTGQSPKKYYIDIRSFGPYIFFWWRTGPYTAVWPLVPWTICYVVPVYTLFLHRSISAFQSISRNSEGHVESVQPIKCTIFILICNKYIYKVGVISVVLLVNCTLIYIYICGCGRVV